jgi:phospholipase/carboxylesterase
MDDDDGNSVTRRLFLRLGAGFGAFACAPRAAEQASPEPSRLRARPGQTRPQQPLPPGGHALGLGTRRDGLLYVPRDLAPDSPAPLVILLHGAGGAARGMTSRVQAFATADRFRTVVLAIDSRGATWDVIGGQFGPDVTFLDAALAHTFARVAIDPARLAIGGFSDGASYALSLGVLNGDLFTHVIAFSPGFLAAERPRGGRPAIYVSHGTNDEILPIARTSRRLVPALKDAGYAVRYHEFTGPHTVPLPIVQEAFEWLNAPAGTHQPVALPKE